MNFDFEQRQPCVPKFTYIILRLQNILFMTYVTIFRRFLEFTYVRSIKNYSLTQQRNVAPIKEEVNYVEPSKPSANL